MRKRLGISLLLALALAVSLPVTVLAHAGQPDAGSLWGRWSFDPITLLLLGSSAFFFARGQKVIRRRAGFVPGRRRWQSRSFWAGWAILALALLSPLDALAGELFAAHMAQHTMLMLLAAPLLVLAVPLPPLLLGLPAGWSKRLGRFWGSRRWPGRLWNTINRPILVWLLMAAVLWLWHAPGLYQAAVASDAVHALQHVSFLGAALLFWWVAIHTLGMQPEKRGAGVLYLFTTALHSGLLGALITFSPAAWYPVYAGSSEAWGLTALADQQLAGTIMWVPAGLVYLLAALVLMKVWLDGLEGRQETAGRKELE